MISEAWLYGIFGVICVLYTIVLCGGFRAERGIAKIVYALLVVLFVCAVFYFVMVARTQADCLRMGFPGYEVTVGLDRYCVARDGRVHLLLRGQL